MTDDVPLYRSRYRGYDVLAKDDDWDDLTRELVLKRVRDVPPIRFFTPAEARALQALFDALLPQHDRPLELRVPILNHLDERLAEGEGEGYRIEGLPHDPVFWRAVAAAVDDEARLAFSAPIAELAEEERVELVRRIQHEASRQAQAEESFADFGARPLVFEGDAWETPPADAPPLESPHWARLPLKFAFPLMLWEAVSGYYGHPHAWSEIGFGGPVFPRIYARTVRDNPKEAQEVPRGAP